MIINTAQMHSVMLLSWYCLGPPPFQCNNVIMTGMVLDLQTKRGRVSSVAGLSVQSVTWPHALGPDTNTHKWSCMQMISSNRLTRSHTLNPIPSIPSHAVFTFPSPPTSFHCANAFLFHGPTINTSITFSFCCHVSHKFYSLSTNSF